MWFADVDYNPEIMSDIRFKQWNNKVRNIMFEPAVFFSDLKSLDEDNTKGKTGGRAEGGFICFLKPLKEQLGGPLN